MGCSIGSCMPRAYGVRAYNIRPNGTPAAPAATTRREICARVLCLGRKRGLILVAQHLVRTWAPRQQMFSRVDARNFRFVTNPSTDDDGPRNRNCPDARRSVAPPLSGEHVRAERRAF